MDRFQATPPGLVTEARGRSAAVYGDAILCEALKIIHGLGGSAALQSFREAANSVIEDGPPQDTQRDLLREICVEEIERAIGIAEGKSDPVPRGWTEDGPAATEEKKP